MTGRRVYRRIVVEVEPELDARLQEYCAQTRQTKKAVIVDALEAYLGQRESQPKA